MEREKEITLFRDVPGLTSLYWKQNKQLAEAQIEIEGLRAQWTHETARMAAAVAAERAAIVAMIHEAKAEGSVGPAAAEYLITSIKARG